MLSLCLLVILCVSLYYLFPVFNTKRRRRRQQHHQPQLPPGTSGWPIIGEGLAFLMANKSGVPERFIEERKVKYSSSSSSDGNCNVFITSLLRESVAVFCSAAGNKFLFSSENKLVKQWWPSNIDAIFEGSENTNTAQEAIRHRKVLLPFLSPDSLRKYVGIMDSATKRHMDVFWSDQKKQVHYALALTKMHTFELVCKIFLSVEDPKVIAKLEEPIQHIQAGFIALPVNLPGTTYNRAIKSSKQLNKQLEEIIRQRRMDLDRQDLVSKLLMEKYSDGQQLKDRDIANKLKGLLIAAYDNVFITICSIMIYLAEYPQVYDAVLKEQMEIANAKAKGEFLNWEDIQKMRYTWNMASEVLRLESPNPGTFREALTDFDYEGFLIPKGMKLYWSVFSTHRNAEYFPDPMKFDPSRFEGGGPAPFSFVPFGGGPRMCPGREYARFTILVFVHNLVTRFKWEKVFPDEKMVMNPFLLPTKGLPVRLYPHPSSSTSV